MSMKQPTPVGVEGDTNAEVTAVADGDVALVEVEEEANALDLTVARSHSPTALK